jgi:predicted ATP-grasp superfamily ATP-dependent carboligase
MALIEKPEPAESAAARKDTGNVYDILILDAATRQSLASARSLGQAGLRVALGECSAECGRSRPAPAFRSRFSSRNVVLPDIKGDGSEFGAAVVDFVRENPTRVVLPNGDGVIAALTPRREALAALGCVLALAPNSALEIANDKDRTLAVARKLGIDCPKTMRIDSLDELPALLSEFKFPFVLKPTTSWTEKSAGRLVPVEVIDETEAVEVIQRILAAGAGVLAQQWASGRREGVSLLIADGEVLASCAHVAYRTSPPLGGASVMRESISAPPDIYASAVSLAVAVGIEGVCEVEFRRDAENRPLLMEINARLAGTIENATRSGVDFPLLLWQWAAGLPVDRVSGYRTGVRTRWLRGDMRWLRENYQRVGRPDSVSRARSFWIFAQEFVRTSHYDCFDRHDLRPVIAEAQIMIKASRKSGNRRSSAERAPQKGNAHENPQ